MWVMDDSLRRSVVKDVKEWIEGKKNCSIAWVTIGMNACSMMIVVVPTQNKGTCTYVIMCLFSPLRKAKFLFLSFITKCYYKMFFLHFCFSPVNKIKFGELMNCLLYLAVLDWTCKWPTNENML